MSVFNLRVKKSFGSAKNSAWKVPVGLQFQVVSTYSSFPTPAEIKPALEKAWGFELGNVSLGSDQFEVISKS
jgi:hypothetical protein